MIQVNVMVLSISLSLLLDVIWLILIHYETYVVIGFNKNLLC